MESSTLASPHTILPSMVWLRGLSNLKMLWRPVRAKEGCSIRAVPTEQEDIDGSSSSVSADDKMATLTSPRFQDVKHTQHCCRHFVRHSQKHCRHLVRRSQKRYPHFFQQWARTDTAVFHSIQPVVVRTPETLCPQMTTKGLRTINAHIVCKSTGNALTSLTVVALLCVTMHHYMLYQHGRFQRSISNFYRLYLVN